MTAAGCPASEGLLGVQVIHHPTAGRRYNLILIEDEQPALPIDIRLSLEAEFGIFDGSTVWR